MAVDPNVIFQVGRGVTPINTPLQNQQAVLTLKNLAQTNDLNAARLQDYQDQTQERAQAAVMAQAGAQQQHAVDDLMANSLIQTPDGSFTYDRAKIQADLQANPTLKAAWPKISQALDASDAAIKKFQDAKKATLGEIAAEVDRLGNTPSAFHAAVAQAVKNGVVNRDELQPYLDAVDHDPTTVARITGSLMGKKPETGFTLSPGQTHFDASGNTVASVAPSAPKPAALGSFEDFLGRWAKERGKDPAALTSGEIATAQKQYKPQSEGFMGQIMGQTDPKAIASSVISGDLPPDLNSFSRYAKDQIASELAKSGFSLSSAMTDWKATQKHLATLNGAQQTRLQQAIGTASESLGVIEDLANQWNGGKFPLLNKATLSAAKNGVLGPDAQKIATNLEAQITDVTSELGNVYMGGNSPTDHALQLAEKNLSANWTRDQLLSAVNLARTNLKIRENSIKNSGVVGASAGNPYAPKTEVPAQPAPSGGLIEAKDPQGQIHHAPAGTPLPAGWTLVKP